MNDPKIDFVISWVDGNDPAWQESKNRCLKEYLGREVDASSVRYRDWEFLRYWFRAVEKYAPWVNRVFFVTCGHTPDWLNPDAPKLRHVVHSDYIPEEYLPTFSSHPIELNLHRILGLSEQFVYFNDDFFLTAPTTPEDFFVGGLPCDCIEERPIEFCERNLYNHILVNDIIFANRHFSRLENRREHAALWYSARTPHISARNLLLGAFRCRHFFGLHTHHLPQAYLKRTLSEVWEVEPEWLAETCRHRFRSQEDVSQCVFKFWQLLNGTFVPYDKRRYGKVYQIGSELNEIDRALTGQRYKFLCLNDDTTVEDFEQTKAKLLGLFDSVLPEKSSFER